MLVYYLAMHFAMLTYAEGMFQKQLYPISIQNVVEIWKATYELLIQRQKEMIFCIEFLQKMNNGFITPILIDRRHECHLINQFLQCRNRVFMAVNVCCYLVGLKVRISLLWTITTASDNQWWILEATSIQLEWGIEVKTRRIK